MNTNTTTATEALTVAVAALSEALHLVEHEATAATDSGERAARLSTLEALRVTQRLGERALVEVDTVNVAIDSAQKITAIWQRRNARKSLADAV